MGEYISDRKSEELNRQALHIYFECEMKELDERLISPEEAMDMLRQFIRVDNKDAA